MFYKAPQKKSNPRWWGPAAILDIDESGVVLKFQSQTFKVARYCVRRKLEEKDLPQGSAAGDSQLHIDWEMPKPLVLPSQGGEPWELAPTSEESSEGAPKPLARETLSTDSTKEAPVEDTTEASERPPRPDDPVPMSLDSVDPTPSDESRTELYERTCGDIVPTEGERGREKRPRSPEFVPEKRIKHDALRLAFVGNKDTSKAHRAHHLASVDGSQAIEGMEAALAAWVATQCERHLGQELSSVDELRFAKEVEAAKCRQLDAWCKFQVFSPVPQTKVTKDVVETRWVLTWKALGGKRTVKARLVARGLQDPDLADGLVDTSSCVSLRPSHLQAISLSALKKWKLRSLDIKNAFL